VFEDFCHARFAGAQRYWESDVELDLVAPDPEDQAQLLVAEVKCRRLSDAERRNVLRQLEGKWNRCTLRPRHPKARLAVIDASGIASDFCADGAVSSFVWPPVGLHSVGASVALTLSIGANK